MDAPDRRLRRTDVDRPSAARIYDYFLGGAHNFAVDRAAAAELVRSHPAIGLGMRANRSYLRRAVRYLAQHGVDQFLDLGSGIPTVGNVHEIAQRVNAAARVVYVDHEPIAVTHSNTILADDDRAVAVQADLRDHRAVLDHPDTRVLLDLRRPVGLILVGVLQYLTDADDPAAVIAGYRDRLATGSYFVLSHPTVDHLPAERAAGARAATGVYQRSGTPFTYRTRAQFEALFAGLRLVNPGVVYLWEWRAETEPDPAAADGRVAGLAGVGRKP